jgi:hypothetical protein
MQQRSLLRLRSAPTAQHAAVLSLSPASTTGYSREGRSHLCLHAAQPPSPTAACSSPAAITCTHHHDVSTESFLTCYFSARSPERHPLGCM